jgi:hypothetical protein
MRRITVPVLEHWDEPPRACRGWEVNRYYAVVRVERQWRLIHRASGLGTRHKKPSSRATLIAMGLAATRRFGSIQDETRPSKLEADLIKAGSREWSARWWKRHAKKQATA